MVLRYDLLPIFNSFRRRTCNRSKIYDFYTLLFLQIPQNIERRKKRKKEIAGCLFHAEDLQKP